MNDRILFVTDAPTVGGSEIYLREMLPLLRERGLNASVALPDVPGTADIRRQITERGVPVQAYRSLKDVPRDARLTMLSSWNPKGYRKYYRHFGFGCVALVHDQLMLFIPGVPRVLYRFGYEIMQAGDLRRAKAVVTVSRWGARHLREQHRVANVHAAQNGVNTTIFRPGSAEERAELRSRFGFERFTVLVPARLSPEKNHVMVLATARRTPHLDFVLVGNGPLGSLLRKLAPRNVRFLGKRWDMPELYRAADAVLQPTIGENQSLATLEAMASGLPVVTNDIPAQRELLGACERGIVVRNRVTSYADALLRLHASTEFAVTLGARARAHVLGNHTIEQAADRLSVVLRAILAREA